MLRFACLLALLTLLAGCGGTAASPSSASGNSNSKPSGPSAPPPPVTPVSVSAGQTVPNVDVTVSTPSSATPPNVQDLGAGNACGAKNACNTGDLVHRGSSPLLLMFGPGLTADMQLSVNGPDDITFDTPVAVVSNPSSPGASGTPGLQVTAHVSSSAALGARTLVLRAPSGDITTFTGGLEVVP